MEFTHKKRINKFGLHTSLAKVDLSYAFIKNCSKIGNSASSDIGSFMRFRNARVSSGNVFQIFQNVNFPLPKQTEFESQPVSAWNKTIAMDLSMPSVATML